MFASCKRADIVTVQSHTNKSEESLHPFIFFRLCAGISNEPITLVQIRIWFCEVKKAEHLLACGWALEKPIATLRRLSLDSSQQYFLTNSAVDSSFRI